jgi:hypothetical protein
MSRPRTGRRPSATVAIADFRFCSTSSAPETSTAASDTLGVPTASRTTDEGLGVSTAASLSAE